MGFIFNFIRRIIKLTIKLSLYLAIFGAIIVVIPNLPPYGKFTSIELTPTQPRVGPLAPNDALNKAEQIYKGKLLGPEAFQLLNGELFTSLATGEIVKVSPGGHVTFVTKIGQPCTGLSKEHICGRPLGFQIDDKSNTLYVADAYYGIWKVDLKTDKKQLLVSPHVEIDQRQPKLFNSIALAKNGDFYWTDSSSDFHLKDGAISLLTDPSGRVFHYNAATNQSKVLVDNVWFANGLVLSPNNEFLVISETCKYRLIKHYVAGPKKGNTEVFVDGLPGAPDNLRVLPDGSGLLVSLYTVFDDEHPLLTQSMAKTPIVRKFLARLQRLIEIPVEYLNTLYPHVVFEDIVYTIGHFKSISGFTPAMSGLLQLDWNGNIVATYFNTDGSLGHISDAIVHNDKLYTGNPHAQDFIGVVPAPPLLKKAFESSKKTDLPKVDSKPQQPKPVQQSKPKVEVKPELEKPKVETKPKVEEKPKLEEKPKVATKPKVEQKPKLEEKPKVETKPKVEQKPKLEEKPKVETKPKVEPKAQVQTPPKVEQAKPVKSDGQAKSAQAPKPAEVPKTNDKKQSSTKVPKQEPMTTTPPPTKPTAPPVKPKELPKEQPKPTPKPEAKTAPPAKPTEKATTQPPKTATKPDQPKKAQKPIKQETPSTPQGKIKEEIPIKEDIPSDTAKPTKETLKVIKKGGVPTEIPVPNQ